MKQIKVKPISWGQINTLPKTYRFNPFVRFFTVILGLFATYYSLWLIFTKLNQSSSNITKYAPFLILFLALNSLMKNLFTLNAIKLEEDKINFYYLLKKTKSIFWKDITRMEFYAKKMKAIKIFYNENGKNKTYYMLLNMPKMLEVINTMAEKAVNCEFDEYLETIVNPLREVDNENKK
jgi:hypothetical protein